MQSVFVLVCVVSKKAPVMPFRSGKYGRNISINIVFWVGWGLNTSFKNARAFFIQLLSYIFFYSDC